MIKLRNIKNSFSNIKTKYLHKIIEDEALERYMFKLVEEAEEDLKNGGELYSLEEWREIVKLEYGIEL